jgi:MFS transporter, PAT family, beta-lactamase induction signal transducer AmpG
MASIELVVDRRTPQAAAPPRTAVPAWRWIATLFFAEGLPATVVASLSVIILKHLQVPNARIAVCASGLMLPWTLRPLWSPLLEVFGTKRSFVVAMEAAIALCLAGIAIGLAAGAGPSLCILLFAIIALCAATHDMAADGLFIRSLPAESQRRYVGWLSVAFNGGKLTAQGLLVVMVGQLAVWRGALFAWQVGFLVLAAITSALAFYHYRVLPDEQGAVRERSHRSLAQVGAATKQVITSFFGNGRIAWLLALIVVYRVAEGQVLRIVPLFLLDSRGEGGLGFSTAQLGALYGGVGGITWAIGAVIGGWTATKLGERRAFVPLCLAFNLPTLVYLFLAGVQPSLTIVAVAIAVEQIAYGIGSIGLKLAVLSAAKGPYETAHCAFAGALAGIGAVAAGMFSGTSQATFGYFGFFGWALLAAALPLAAAWICSRQES